MIVAPDDQDSAVGDTARVVIGASDPDGDAFEFSATGLPPGARIHPTNGVISGTLTAPGEYAVTVIADGRFEPMATATRAQMATFLW